MGLRLKIKSLVSSRDLQIDDRTRQIIYRDRQLSSLFLCLVQKYPLSVPQF